MVRFPISHRTRNFLFRFIADSRSIGIVLLLCTAVSLIVANSGFGEGYLRLLHAHWPTFKRLGLPYSPSHIINDALMAVFFFLAGLEIKRELIAGELSSVKKAILPVSAALGGMFVPAVIYILLNKGSVYQHGWGIPMATDIAFSLGVASLLGARFPTNLKVFLTALAIIDDLGAILVIALFYGESIHFGFLAASGAVVVLLYLINKKQLPFGWLQLTLGLLLWFLVYNSGIHATIAGIAFAFTVPVAHIEKLENHLHKPVNFLVLPLFALANTALNLGGAAGPFSHTMGIGIVLGLVLGKPIGIYLGTRLVVQAKLAQLPKNIGWSHLIGAGLLAGIGFTISIFIAQLAFALPKDQTNAKIAVLVASLAAAVLGSLWLRFAPAGSKATR